MMDISKNILDTIDFMINERLKSVGCNYYLTGVIKSISGTDYTVTINGTDSIYKARTGITLVVGNVVYIICPNGNQGLAFIDCVRP